MKVLKSKWRLYDLFIVVAVLYLILSFFDSGQSLDMTLHDSYYLIASQIVTIGVAGIFFLGWVLYRFFGRYLLSKRLIDIHVILTLLLLFAFESSRLWSSWFLPRRTYYSFSTFNSEPSFFIVYGLLLIISVIILMINVIGGVVKTLTKSKI